MNLIKRMAFASVLALTVAGTAIAPVSATTQTGDCRVNAVGTTNTTGQADSRFAVVDGKVTARFIVEGDSNCTKDVTLAVWQAPDGDKGKPFDQQKLFAHKTDTFSVGTHDLTVDLPDCYYQVDLVRGSNSTDKDGGPLYGSENMIAALHGGTTVCETSKPPVETPVTPPATTTPAEETPFGGQGGATEEPTVLPNTGVGANVAIFAGAAMVLGTAFQYMRQLRRN